MKGLENRMRPLPARHALFIDNYLLNKFDGTAAYLATYPGVKNAKTAQVNASRLLSNAMVSAEIGRRQGKAREENEGVVARIRKELEAGAFANIDVLVKSRSVVNA